VESQNVKPFMGTSGDPSLYEKMMKNSLSPDDMVVAKAKRDCFIPPYHSTNILVSSKYNDKRVSVDAGGCISHASHELDTRMTLKGFGDYLEDLFKNKDWTSFFWRVGLPFKNNGRNLFVKMDGKWVRCKRIKVVDDTLIYCKGKYLTKL